MAYSGGEKKDISVEAITGIPQTIVRIRNGDFKKLSGVAMTYTGGQVCEKTGEPTQFRINLYCNPSGSWTSYDYSAGMMGDICNPHFDLVSRAACPRLSVSDLWGYLEDYSYYFGAVLLVAGLGLVFAGRQLIKPAVCFAGFLTTVLVSCIIFYSVYLEDESDLSDFWYFFGGGALVGIFAGLFACWAARFGAALLAGWGGLCGGLILYESVIYRAEQPWLLYVVLVLCSLTAAVFTFVHINEAVIVSTVVLGAYSLVRGTACYAGHYYNEITMAKLAEEGLLADIDPWYWAYVVGFFLFTVVGTAV